MKRFQFVLLFLLTLTQINAQILNPVSWDFSYNELGNDEYELIFKATMDEGWTVYSQHNPEDEGPIPTHIEYEEAEGFDGYHRQASHPQSRTIPEFFRAL